MHGLYRPAWQRKDRQKRALSLSTLKKRSWKRSTVNYYLFAFLLFSLFQLSQASSSHHHHSHSHSRTLGRERRSETGKKRLQLGARQLLGADVSPGGGTATDAAANEDNEAVDVARATDALTDSSVNNSTITDAQTTTSQSSDSETATPSQISSDSVKRSTSPSSSSDSTTSTTSPTTTPIPPSTPAQITTPTSTPTPPPTATPPPKKAEQGLVSFLFDKKKNKFFPAVIAGCVLIGFAVILVVLFIFRFVAQRRYARTQYKRFVPVFDGPSDSSTGAASNEKGAGMDAAPPIAIASRQLPDALFSRPAPARLADNDSLLFLDRRRLQRPPPQQQRRQRQQQMPEVQPEPIVYRHPTKRREREASQNSATSINSNGPPPTIPPTFTRPATPQRYPDARGLFISKVQPPAPVYHQQELSRPAMQQMSNWESMMVPSQAPADGNASHRPEVSHRDHRNQGMVAKDPIHAAVEQMLERKKSEEISRARAPARDLGDGKRKERKKGQAIRKKRTD